MSADGAARVLLIEDDLENRIALHALLEAWGYSVITAASGEEGLRRASTFEPDVVIVDLGLPDEDGHEVAEAFRARKTTSPFLIAYTGAAREDDRTCTPAATFDRFVMKPDVEGLFAALCALKAAEERRIG